MSSKKPESQSSRTSLVRFSGLKGLPDALAEVGEKVVLRDAAVAADVDARDGLVARELGLGGRERSAAGGRPLRSPAFEARAPHPRTARHRRSSRTAAASGVVVRRRRRCAGARRRASVAALCDAPRAPARPEVRSASCASARGEIPSRRTRSTSIATTSRQHASRRDGHTAP